MVSALFALPVNPPAARSRQSPSGRSTTAGHASAHWDSNSSTGCMP
jgi:hypothetical protein